MGASPDVMPFCLMAPDKTSRNTGWHFPCKKPGQTLKFNSKHKAMNLVKHNRNRNYFPSVMDEFFRPDFFNREFNANVPPVNIRETDTAFEVELSAPGKKKEDFVIDLENDLLTISSEHTEEKTEGQGKYTRREFSHTSFRRAFTLPETAKDDNIKASYENGILKISIPKKEEALPKPKRQIDIE
jgi:HSP20 family protein